MPKIENMLQTMREQGIPEETISQPPMPRIKKATPEEIVVFINRMDEFLSKEQCVSIMGEQRCNKTNKYSARHRLFGKDKSHEEKIALLHELDTPHKVDVCLLNDDGTITLKFGIDGKKGNWSCPCIPIKKLKPLKFSLTYCGCCGAHVQYLHEFSLGVKLRLKEIISSKANSDGEKPCEFVYDIVG